MTEELRINTGMLQVPTCDSETGYHPMYTKDLSTGVCRCEKCGMIWQEIGKDAETTAQHLEHLRDWLSNQALLSAEWDDAICFAVKQLTGRQLPECNTGPCTPRRTPT